MNVHVQGAYQCRVLIASVRNTFSVSFISHLCSEGAVRKPHVVTYKIHRKRPCNTSYNNNNERPAQTSVAPALPEYLAYLMCTISKEEAE